MHTALTGSCAILSKAQPPGMVRVHRILALGIRHQSTDRAGQAVDVLLEVEALVPELYNQLPILTRTQVLSDALCHILTTCDANTLSLAIQFMLRSVLGCLQDTLSLVEGPKHHRKALVEIIVSMSNSTE